MSECFLCLYPFSEIKNDDRNGSFVKRTEFRDWKKKKDETV